MPFLKEKGREKVLDFLGIDYYDPFLSNYFLSPPHFIRLHPHQWDCRPHEFAGFLESYFMDDYSLPLFVLEHGMAYKKRISENKPGWRKDGKSRIQELEKILTGLDKAVLEKKLPILGFCYWSILDNYEWGSFVPRFGLFGMDYYSGKARITDSKEEKAGMYYQKEIEKRKG